MKTIFLAGGKGSRMRPLTDNVPKPMVPIMNKPLIERTMVHLKKFGINRIVISSCYKSKFIENYFGNGESFGLDIKYIVEDKPLGTGGAIRKAGEGSKKTFIVINSDILSDIDICKMLEFHKKSHSIATIAVVPVKNAGSYGLVDFDENGYVKSFKEKPEVNENEINFINAGIYIFEPEILSEIPVRKVVSVERDVFPKLLQKGYKMSAYKDNHYWMDIGNIKKYLQTHKDVMEGKINLVDHDFSKESVKLGKNVNIHPDAIINGPAYIGDNVTIEAKTVINNSVIGNNVCIGYESKIIGSVVWDDIIMRKGVKVKNIVLTPSSVHYD